MFGDLGKMMKIAGQVKSKLPEMQEKLADAKYSADAGGVVTATVNGKMALVDLEIDPSVLADAQNDPEILTDVIKAAVTTAQSKAAEAAAEAMKEITGGMEIPGLSGLFG